MSIKVFNKSNQYTAINQSYQQNNRKKKKLITIAVVTILLPLAVFLIIVIMTNVSSTQEKNERVSYIRRIGNYILFGENIDQAISDPYDRTRGYKIEGMSYSSVYAKTKEEFDQEIAGIDTYYDTLLDIINEIKITDTEEDKKISDYLENLRSYITLQKTNYLDERYVVAYFKNEGYIGAITYIDDFYSSLLNDEDENVRDVGDLEVRRLKVRVDEYRAYEQVGCVSGYTITGCDKEIKVNERNESFEELNNLKNLKMDGIRDQAIKGFWRIYE